MPITNAIGYRHAKALDIERKIKICKKHVTFEVIV